MKKGWLVIVLICMSFGGFAQQGGKGRLLDSLSRSVIPRLNERLSFSVSDLPLKEFIRALTHDAGVNVVIPTGLDGVITNNFDGVRAADILAYICEEYDLDIAVNGNIICLMRNELPLPLPPPVGVRYDRLDGKFTFELKGEVLSEVVKAISLQAGINVIASPAVKDCPINSYVHSLPVEEALDMMCRSADLRLECLGAGLFMVTTLVKEPEARGDVLQVRRVEHVKVDSSRGISLNVKEVSQEELFCYVMQETGRTFRLLVKPEEKVSMNVQGASLDEFLYQLFKGSRYTYCLQNGIYYVGERDKPELKKCHMLVLQHRSVVGLINQLPKPVLNNLEVKEFDQLNGLLIYGDTDRVEDFICFAREIDKTVPVVLIDVVLVDISDRVSLDIGLDVGLGGDGSSRKGGSSSGIGIELNGHAFNKVMKEVGWVNLGKVPADFYLKLKAMEDNGYANIRSTPRLSTLNGSEAKMSVGRTEYYKEERQDYFGTQDPQLSKQITYKEVQAELSVVMRPVVAGDGSVSLSVKVEQSDFTERLTADGPPGKTSRKFESTIRVMDREMILLGGLEEETDKRSTKGVPFLSRVPLIKWLFGSSQKAKIKNRLNILIKPVIIW